MWDQFKRRQIIKAYLLDWVLVVIFLLGFFAIDRMEPYHRRFSLDDKTIQYPYSPNERVPIWLCIVISILFPFITMTIMALVVKKSLHDWHHAILGLMLALSLTLMVTSTVKNQSGRPRPDFIDRCQPSNGSADATSYGLSTSDICTQKDLYLIKDGFKSFFSGHSSFSFAGLGYLSLYLAGKLRAFDKKGYTIKGFVIVTPLVIATLIAISRTQDYRHHWEDVAVGSIIGFSFAFFSYRQYYPSLASSSSDIPYSTRLTPPKLEHKADFELPDGLNFEVIISKHDSVTRQDYQGLLSPGYTRLPEVV